VVAIVAKNRHLLIVSCALEYSENVEQWREQRIHAFLGSIC
jgi:hypothetical protein